MTRAHSAHKASFSELYDQPDPRPYYRMLHHYDYRTPANGQRAFGRLLALLRARGEERPGVADLCCSYGVMSALLSCDLTWDDLYERYRDPALDDLTADELAADDKAWYADHRHPDASPIVGIDVAARAVAYGEQVGLLTPGFAENLEEHDSSAALRAALRPTRLVTVSGGVSYITERTVRRLLACCDEAPWFAAFALRTYDYDTIARACAEHGLVTERLEGVTFRQRRFVSDEERAVTIDRLTARGLDPTLEADDGYYHTELYVSRPAAAVAAAPLAEVLADAV